MTYSSLTAANNKPTRVALNQATLALRRKRALRRLQLDPKPKPNVVHSNKALSVLGLSRSELTLLRGWVAKSEGSTSSKAKTAKLLPIMRKVSLALPPRPPTTLYRGLILDYKLILATLLSGGTSLDAKGSINSWTSDSTVARRYLVTYQPSKVGVLLSAPSAKLDVLVAFNKKLLNLLLPEAEVLEQKEYLCASSPINTSDIKALYLSARAVLALHKQGLIPKLPYAEFNMKSRATLNTTFIYAPSIRMAGQLRFIATH